MSDDKEGFQIISDTGFAFEFNKAYPFTITGENGEAVEMMAFVQELERNEWPGLKNIFTTRLAAHQITGRQKP
jgi:hypothetical protein